MHCISCKNTPPFHTDNTLGSSAVVLPSSRPIAVVVMVAAAATLVALVAAAATLVTLVAAAVSAAAAAEADLAVLFLDHHVHPHGVCPFFPPLSAPPCPSPPPLLLPPPVR